MFGSFVPMLLNGYKLAGCGSNALLPSLKVLVSFGAGAIALHMLQAGLYVLVILMSGVSAALILANGQGNAEARFPQGIAHLRGYSSYKGCRVSPCQIAYLNSVEDFCLWAPSRPFLSPAGDTEHTFVAWCIKSTHGTRTIPEGTIEGARLIVTPEYIQISGVGELTNINVPADGVASSSGEGDRAHGLVFTHAYGQLEQIHDWTGYMSQKQFCFRACKPSLVTSCPPIHDLSVCSETVPNGYDAIAFEDCVGDATPASYQAHLHQTSPRCTDRATVGNTQATRARREIISTSGSTSSALLTSFLRWHTSSQGQNTPLTFSSVPTSTNTATIITFPSFPTSTSTATSVNFSTPAPSNASTSTLYSYNHTHTYSHSSHTSRYHSPSSNFSQFYSSTALSFNNPSLTTFTPSPTPTNSTFSGPPSPSTSAFTSTFTPTSSFVSSSSSSSSSSFSQSSSYSSFTPSSTANLTSLPTSSLPPSTSPSNSPFVSPSPLTSSSSQVVPVPTSSSSTPISTTSPATSSPTSSNSQTQIGSQCLPPSQLVVNGTMVPPIPLLSLILLILTILLSACADVLEL